jgi:hypothetical protein
MKITNYLGPPQARQFKLKIFIVPGGDCCSQPPPIMHFG